MESRILALIASFIAMAFVILSYFTTKKERFLLLQSLCIVFLILSYFFTLQFFAMVGLSIGLCRVLVYFWYEKKGREAPLFVPLILCALTAISYFAVNFAILESASAADALLLVALVCYIFIFRVRNLTLVRFLMLVPTVLAIIFNIVTGAALFAVLSYVFELSANVASIFKYHVFGKKRRKAEKAPR